MDNSISPAIEVLNQSYIPATDAADADEKLSTKQLLKGLVEHCGDNQTSVEDLHNYLITKFEYVVNGSEWLWLLKQKPKEPLLPHELI